MKTLKLACLGALVLVAGACKTPSPVADHWGEALQRNRDVMIENPVPTRTAEGLGSLSAEHVLENYSEGQDEQEHRRDRSLSEDIR